MELQLEVVVAVLSALVALGAAGWLLWKRPAAGLLEDEAAQGQAPAASVGVEDSSLADRFFRGLARSREALSRSLGLALGGAGPLDERLDQLEEALIAADVGARTASSLVEGLRRQARADDPPERLRALLRAELLGSIGPRVPLAGPPSSGPLVVLVVGVNGSGKTTTIGKLASRFTRQGKGVVLAAGDTFRAGAIEQLRVWGERAGATVVAHQEGADPAAVVFDGIKAGQARGADVVICDTAGRLQAQKLLMDELGKVVRVIRKADPAAPHEALLVLDATIGQNALSQAREFKQVVGVTGVVLTKLDGTARGGVVVAVHKELGLPVKLVGLGEQADDLREFDPEAFVDALLGPA
ncbi:signal recognition particle-docking protein FtsY [Myxococcota bacterium]|nr:signal recognition particle-docking protein FtsY [Myxococcota bacterium]